MPNNAGGRSISNGGTVKVFGTCPAIIATNNITTGRFFR